MTQTLYAHMNNKIIKKRRRINLEGNTHAQVINVSQLPVWLSLSQLTKTLGPSYYCLYSLFNKIRDKGKILSAGY
jgi:hypothetical protein